MPPKPRPEKVPASAAGKPSKKAPPASGVPNPRVDGFVRNLKTWKDEFSRLRQLVLEAGLTEDVKWGQPCYTKGDANIVLIHGFKDYCALLFFKGALLKDPYGVLVQQTENVQSARQIRFQNLAEIEAMTPVIKEYLDEAIAVETAGLKVEKKKTAAYAIPEELQQKFAAEPAFQKAFEALTPGRQRGYLLFFGSAKQAKTRVARIEKYRQAIFEGKGVDD